MDDMAIDRLVKLTKFLKMCVSNPEEVLDQRKYDASDLYSLLDEETIWGMSFTSNYLRLPKVYEDSLAVAPELTLAITEYYTRIHSLVEIYHYDPSLPPVLQTGTYHTSPTTGVKQHLVIPATPRAQHVIRHRLSEHTLENAIDFIPEAWHLFFDLCPNKDADLGALKELLIDLRKLHNNLAKAYGHIATPDEISSARVSKYFYSILLPPEDC